MNKIKLVCADVHISNNPSFVDDKRRRTCDIVSVKAQPMIDTVTFDDIPRLVDQQWERDPIFFDKASEFTGPLSGDSERRGGIRLIRLDILLDCRQLATTVRSPRTSEESEDNVL